MTDSIEGRPLALAGSTARPLRWMVALSFLPLLIAIGVLFLVVAQTANTRAGPPLPILVAVPVLIGLVQFFMVSRLTRIGVSVGQGDLIVETGFGRKRVPLSHLRKHGVRIVDLRHDNRLKPFLRLMGTSLPGLTAGRYRLRNGENAMCLLLERDRVSYLRSDADDVSLLLSLKQPESLRALLER
ncbi:MAG TPA: hypothetical protein VFB32_07795 [Rudaea sp.]|nr:hypothetical protein [Rudaea sp.]